MFKGQIYRFNSKDILELIAKELNMDDPDCELDDRDDVIVSGENTLETVEVIIIEKDHDD
jgi:hypothetical protein